MRSPEELRNVLRRHAGGAVDLTITRNRVSMVAVKFIPFGSPKVRLNRIFLEAPDPILESLGMYLATRSAPAWKQVCGFVASRGPDPVVSRPLRVRTLGQHFNLAAIIDRINRLYFDGAVLCHIGWAKPGHRRGGRSRTIRYGTYNRSLNLIRINPLLDDARVPPEFVDYIVFHEMLHAAVPSKQGAGRWRHHHGSFRILERRYPDHERMKKMAGELVLTLGRGRRPG